MGFKYFLKVVFGTPDISYPFNYMAWFNRYLKPHRRVCA